MNPYQVLTQQVGGETVRRLAEDLGAWHDEMVMHQRVVRRLGREAACSEDCPHAMGRRLWQEAVELLGPRAEQLRFLRASAGRAS